MIRRFEERVVDLVNANEIAGVTHEYVGQEAVATGVCAALRPDDVITSTHRGHGHLIAKGADVGRMMAELLGRVDGLNRAAAARCTSPTSRSASTARTASSPRARRFAAGAAWTSPTEGSGRVAVTFFGDGGANQGVLHETMNLAALWKLPLVFVCENNGYAVTLPQERLDRRLDRRPRRRLRDGCRVRSTAWTSRPCSRLRRAPRRAPARAVGRRSSSAAPTASSATTPPSGR